MRAVSRAREVKHIMDCVADAECCAVVGLSNMGKSVLLREVARRGGEAVSDCLCVYIDFNLMVEGTEQAFYELILRSARSSLDALGNEASVRERLEAAYRKVVESSNPFLIPLGFNEGIMALCEGMRGRRVVLLFDEFDEPFTQIEPRVLLNLRALRDRYERQLCYVVATGRRLEDMRSGSEVGEFCEMFARNTLYLSPLERAEVERVVSELLAHEGISATEQAVEFVWRETGGHPGLVEAVCHVLAAMSAGGGETDYALVRDMLDSDPNVRSECIKLWNGLGEGDQVALIDFVGGQGVERGRLMPLVQNGILRQKGSELEVFGGLFAGLVRRQRLVRGPYPPGVRVDVDSGEVWVDGRRTPTLTELEYRLLLLLYGRMGKICDKYQIVEAVWGEDYIDRVDDARIEKLVSRLRKKIEPDPNEPRYLQTVRGRGYRLVEA